MQKQDVDHDCSYYGQSGHLQNKISLRNKHQPSQRDLHYSRCHPKDQLLVKPLDLNNSIEKSRPQNLPTRKQPHQIRNIPIINTAHHVLQTLSTYPSSDSNPFSRALPQSRPSPAPLRPQKTHLMGHSMEIRKNISQKRELPLNVGPNGKMENSQYSLNSSRTYTPLSYDSEEDRKSKVSLKSHDSRKASHRQVLACYHYKDLKPEIMEKGPSRVKEESFLSRFPVLCGFGESESEGCNCGPVCGWTQRWMKIIQKAPRSEFEITHEWSKGQLAETVKQVQRDLPRTQPSHPTFQNEKFLQTLKQVLVRYAEKDPEVGYVQGMNFVAAAIIYHARCPSNSLTIFSYLMMECGFRRLFIQNLTYSRILSGECQQRLRQLSFDLHDHLEYEGVQLEMFTSSWYFGMLGNMVPLVQMHHIIDQFILRQFKSLNDIILTLLIKLKPTLLQLYDNQLLTALSMQSMTTHALNIEWKDLVARSLYLATLH